MTIRTAWLTALVCCVASAPAAAQVISGTYTGDNTDNRQIDQLSFQPDVVIVKSATAQTAVIRTSTMVGDASKAMTGATALTANVIQSLDLRSFTIGTDPSVNANAVNYYFVAFKQAAKRMKVGTYTGTGAAQNITGVGFSPEVVFIIPASASQLTCRVSSDGSGNMYPLTAGTAFYGMSALGADGFTLTNDTNVNANGTVYHYIAWNNVPGVMDVGTYDGSVADNVNITTPAFRPEYVIVQRDNAAAAAVHHPASLGPTTDSSLFFTATANAMNEIQALNEDGFQRGTAAEVTARNRSFHYMAWRRTLPEMHVLSGSYTGNGIAGRQIPGTGLTALGFVPNGVIIKASTAQSAVARFWTAFGDVTADLSGAATAANLIPSLNQQGFTVGADARVNAAGVTYNWVAWECGAGEMEVGLYTGNGAASRSITDIGFAPDFVIVIGYNTAPVYRNSQGSATYNFSGAAVANAITGFLPDDGFTIGADASVNTSTNQYMYVAWREIAGRMHVGTYSGNGLDNTSIIGVGFLPQFMLTQSTLPSAPVAHSVAMGTTTDASHFFTATANAANHIQALETNGFQVGTSAETNTLGRTYLYAAWAANEITAVDMIRMSATRTSNGVTLRWRTGYEAGNLGFHIYRERGGERERLTTAPVKGSALLLGPASERFNGFSYRWIDTSAEAGEIRYWIEDIDLDGTTTMHGPIVAPEARKSEPAPGGLAGASGITPGPTLNERRPAAHVAPAVDSSAADDNRASALLTPAASVPARRVDVTGSNDRSPLAVARPVRQVRLSSHVDDLRPTAARVRVNATPELRTQWRLASGPAARIRVRTSGWYSIGQEQLAAAGIDPSIDARHLKLFVDGVEVPIIVRGESDGRFDIGDRVEFYGEGADTPYTDSRIYWLTAGDTPGRRITIADGSPAGAAVPASFPFTFELKERTIYFAALLNGDTENFFGEMVMGEFATEQVLRVADFDRAGSQTARLEVVLQGVTEDPGGHDVAVGINGHAVGTIRFSDHNQGSAAWDIDTAWLVDGDNTVTLQGGSEFDYSLVDTIHLTYMRFYAPDGQRLRSTVPSGSDVLIGPFSDPAIRLIDVTDAARPVEIAASIESSGGGFAIRAHVGGSGTRSLLAFATGGLVAPVEITANAPSRWHRDAVTADVVMISHSAFIAELQPLKQFRERQGHRVALVDIEDVYDEYSFGEKTPFALRRFLVDTYRPNGKPRFVLLVGNATQDPRDYYGFGEPDFLPTKLVPTTTLEAPSDDWFVDSDGDLHADAGMIGRLPVRTAEQAAALVRKILEYERTGNDTWTKSILLVAQPREEGDLDYEAASASLKPFIPSGYAVTALDRPSTPASRGEVVTRINEGQLLVNFVGHGSVEEWGGSLFGRSDVPALTNGSRLPFVVSMNCLNGFFHSLFPEESLAESLVRAPNGGAVAVWASSSVTSPQWQSVMDRELFQQLLAGPPKSLGEAIAAAKRIVGDPDVRRSWILFGDPLTRLKVAAPAATTSLTERSGRGFSRQESSGENVTDDSARPSLRSSDVQYRLVDFNDDGLSDLLLHDQQAGVLRIAYNRRDGFAMGPSIEGVFADPYPARLNDDDLTDLFWYDAATGAWTQALNQGDGTFALTHGSWISGWQVLVADFDGDARSDVFLHQPATGEWFAYLSDGAGGFLVRSGSPLHAGVARAVTLNGDGAADLLIDGGIDHGWSIAVSGGNLQFAEFSLPWDSRLHVEAGDLNGDGRTDFVLWHPGTTTWTDALSRAPGKFSYRSHERTSGGRPHLADLDGDLRDDVLWYDELSGAWSLHLNAASTPATEFGGSFGGGWVVVTGMLDANAGTDLLLYDPASGLWARASLSRDGLALVQTGTLAGRWSVLGVSR